MARILKIFPELWVSAQTAWPHGCCLYLVQEGRHGPVKIGFAEHPVRRLSALQGGNHRKLTLRTIYSGERKVCQEIEKTALRRFAILRNEWLDASLDIMNSFLEAEAV